MSSVLETFFILFSSDSKDVEKGAASAKKSTDQLNTSLKSTDDFGHKINETFSSMARQLIAPITAFASLGAAFAALRASIENTKQLEKVASVARVNIEELSAWSDAVKKTGGSAEAFQGSIKSLADSLATFAVRGRSSTSLFFRYLGINLVDAKGKIKDVFSLLPEIAGAFSRLSREDAIDFAQKIGLDEGTILLLQRGRAEVEALVKRQRELGVVTAKEAETVRKFTQQWDDTTHAFRSLFGVIGSWVLPPLTALSNAFESSALAFREHKDLIIGGLIGIGSAISLYVLPALIKSAIAFAPFFLVTTAILAIGAAFALLYDDVKTFYEGGESLLGDLVQEFPAVAKTVEVIEGAFRLLGKAMNVIAAQNRNLLEVIKTVWGAIAEVIKKAISGITSAVDKVTLAYDKIKSTLGFNNDSDIDINIEKGAKLLLSAQNNPLASVSSNSILNANRFVGERTTNVEVGEINIETQATDSGAIAQEIQQSLKVQLRQAQSNFDDGVDI